MFLLEGISYTFLLPELWIFKALNALNSLGFFDVGCEGLCLQELGSASLRNWNSGMMEYWGLVLTSAIMLGFALLLSSKLVIPCRLGSCPPLPDTRVRYPHMTVGVGRRGGTTRSEACAKPNIIGQRAQPNLLPALPALQGRMTVSGLNACPVECVAYSTGAKLFVGCFRDYAFVLSPIIDSASVRLWESVPPFE